MRTRSDIQSGYERMLNALLPALAGADEISGVGEVWGGMVSSLAQMVIDDEILDYVKRARRGFVDNADSLAVEVISKAMDGARNFLGQKHTVKFMRQGEVLQTRLAKREGWAEWESSGRPGRRGTSRRTSGGTARHPSGASAQRTTTRCDARRDPKYGTRDQVTWRSVVKFPHTTAYFRDNATVFHHT